MTFIPDAYLTALKRKRKQRVDRDREGWDMTTKRPQLPPARHCSECKRQLERPKVDAMGVSFIACKCGHVTVGPPPKR